MVKRTPRQSPRPPKTRGSKGSAHPELTLTRYRQKRDPAQTPEPFDDGAATSEASASRSHARAFEGTHTGAFVVHHHAARRRHYDLRLQVGDVLLSFAVPKGPSLDPAQKRLAVQTEPHPLAYVDFEAVIPHGQYGGGPMIAWDRGRVQYLETSAEEGLLRDKLDFELWGYKLRGRFALIHTGKRAEKDQRQWLLIKKKDGHETKDDVTAQFPESIDSGLTVDALMEAEARVTALEEEALAKGALRTGAPLRAANVHPMLCSNPAASGPSGKDGILASPHFLYELKLDGARILAEKHGDDAALFYRSSRPAGGNFPEIVAALRKLRLDRLVIDGEIVALAPDGKPDFQRLAPRFHTRSTPRPGAESHLSIGGPSLMYWVFDLLAFGSVDLRRLPLVERKALLQRLIPPRGLVSYLNHLDGDGSALLEFCEAQSLEGLVAKRKTSPYQPGPVRSKDWVKIKRAREGEFVVVGFTRGTGTRTLGALDLAAYEHGQLTAVGKVGSGFTDAQHERLLSTLQARRQDQLCALLGTLDAAPRGRTFVSPELVVTVRHQGRLDSGRLRFPVFVALRHDKAPHEATLPSDEEDDAIFRTESPPNGSAATQETAAEPARRGAAAGTLGDTGRVSLTNQQKVFFPESGHTKGDLCRYFDRIAGTMLPYLHDRPTVLVRYPDGIGGKSFYQWRVPRGAPTWLRSVPLSDNKSAFVVDSRDALLYVANLGCIPLHIFARSLSAPDACQFATIDFDLGRGTFAAAVTLARDLLELLEQLGLVGLPKTSGQAGLHVHVPLEGATSFSTARSLTALLGQLLVRRHDTIATLERRKDRRGERVLVDVGQVGPERTVVAPYSPRAVPGARVATPLLPEELTAALDPGRYTIDTVAARIETIGDPMRPLLSAGAPLAAAVDRLDALIAAL